MSKKPEALLLVATGCAHCPAMIEHLTRLLKQGQLSRLEIVNIAEHQELAVELGVRSVPWFRVNDYDFQGVMPFDELSDWVEQLSTGGGQDGYLTHLLEQHQMVEAVERIKEKPSLLSELVAVLGDLDAPMGVRIGIGAIIEELAEKPIISHAIDPLMQLTLSNEPQVRADACHYLGICGDSTAIPAIQALMDDDDPEVREIAAESIAMLHGEAEE